MKKQLLKEVEIRKMMKFADIGALSGGFVGRLTEREELEEPEEEVDAEELGAVEDEAPDMEMGDEEVDVEGTEEAGEEVLDAVRGVVDNLKLALSAAGPEGQAAADAIFVEGGEEGEAKLGGLEGEEELGGLEGEEELGGLEGEEELGGLEGEEEEMMAEFQMVDDEEIEEEMLNEVARRVARKLKLLKRQRDML